MSGDESIVVSIVGLVVGVILGGISGHHMAGDVIEKWNNREALRAECIAGNDRACRLYEVDYRD